MLCKLYSVRSWFEFLASSCHRIRVRKATHCEKCRQTTPRPPTRPPPLKQPARPLAAVSLSLSLERTSSFCERRQSRLGWMFVAPSAASPSPPFSLNISSRERVIDQRRSDIGSKQAPWFLASRSLHAAPRPSWTLRTKPSSVFTDTRPRALAANGWVLEESICHERSGCRVYAFPRGQLHMSVSKTRRSY